MRHHIFHNVEDNVDVENALCVCLHGGFQEQFFLDESISLCWEIYENKYITNRWMYGLCGMQEWLKRKGW